jgi:hypothetical protein
MKKIALSAAFAASALSTTSSFAQETVPSLTVDSTLTVGDSAHFGNNVHVQNRMTVEGQTMLRNDATAERDFRVDGNLYVPNMPAVTDGMDVDPVFVDRDGLLLHGPIGYLKDRLYEFTPCIQGNIAHPAWANGMNRIFVECPQVKVGIATDEPTHNLTNLGNTLMRDHVWMESSASIGADENSFSQLFMKNRFRSAALQINNQDNNEPYNKLIFLEAYSPATELMKGQNVSQNFTPFLATADGSLKVRNAAGNYFDLRNDGKLVIGNATTKNFQFETNGLFRARRIIVDAQAWADFVFEPGYELMPLDAVKTFVNENKHLPAVPTEQQIIGEGIDLAEMNKVLIQKIEELTLYLIEQNDSTAELKVQVADLQSKIAQLENAAK